MANTRHVGNDYNFHVKATVPSSPAVITEYDQLGLEIGHVLTQTGEEIPAVDKDSGGYTNTFVGQQSYQLTITGHLAKDSNVAQKVLEDAALATTQAAKLIFWLSTSDTVGEDERFGSARLISFEITENVNEASTFSITIAGVGAYTLAVGA